ncbi:MAG: PilZ domain-containing protein [Novosphingobium sp.]
MHSLPRAAPGQRSLNRLRLGAPAQLQLTHETRSCLLDDISSSGARLRINQPLTPHQNAVLIFHELKLYSTVMWSKDGTCGLRFDQLLELEDMQGMLWITENRDLYARICNEAHALAWAEGEGD